MIRHGRAGKRQSLLTLLSMPYKLIIQARAPVFRAFPILLLSVFVLTDFASANAQITRPESRVAATRDSVPLSLSEALRRGMSESEEVKLANQSVVEAKEQVASARSGIFPQFDGRLSYQRTIRSPINTGGGFALPDSMQFRPDSLATIAQRLSYLERNTPSAGLGALSSLFTGLPFGQKNTYLGTISISQTLFDPSIFSGLKIAKDFEEAAGAQATEQRLDLGLDVIEAYYGAVLADRQSTIVTYSAEQLLAQAEQVRLIRAAGNASDLDVLRVEVDLQNVEPQRVAALNQRDIALLNLKRLINLPIAQPVKLTETLSSVGFTPVPDAVVASLTSMALERRAAIEAKQLEVKIREEQVSLAKGAYLPRLAANASFGKQALPSDFLPSGGDFKDDWSAGVSVQIPIFNGFKRKAEVEIAKVQLRTSELQLSQLRESISLDVEQQRGELLRAAALIRARTQTVSQAERVYELTNLSYERGLQTNLQLSDARLQLQQARGNEAQALHDYYVALARLLRASGATEAELAQRATPEGMLR